MFCFVLTLYKKEKGRENVNAIKKINGRNNINQKKKGEVDMKQRKVVVLFLVASMVLSLTSCTRQTAAPQEEHISEENDTVQENMMEEDNVEEDQIPEESSQRKDSQEESYIKDNFQGEETGESSDQKEELVEPETDGYEQDFQNSNHKIDEKDKKTNDNRENPTTDASEFQKNEINLNDPEKEILYQQAQQLTEQIVVFSLDAFALEKNPVIYPDKMAIERFLLSVDLFDQQENYPYQNTHRIDQDGTCYFQKESADNMIQEVFDQADWTPVSMNYKEESQEYSFTTGFGIGNNLECQNLKEEFQNSNSTILVSYELWTSSNYPNSHKTGNYQSTFSVCQREDDSKYLRYLNTERVAF